MEIPLQPGFNSIEDLIPPDWCGPRTGRAILIIAYQVQGIPIEAFRAPVACDLKDVRVLFLKGEASFREKVRVTRFWVDKSGCFNVADPEPTVIVKTPDEIHSVFVSPFDVHPRSNTGELQAKRRIDIAAALFASFQGRNLIFTKRFENTYSFETKRASSWSDPFPVPLSFAKPVITAEGFQPVLAAERARWSATDSERNRVELSLRWLGDGMFDMGVNAFLKYWFAIETLTMLSSDLRPLNEMLASIYELPTRAEANGIFNTGLLFRLRGRIVHDGKIVPIDGRLLRYCEFMHHDVLRHVLKLPSEKRLGILLGDRSFDYGTHLRMLVT